MRCASRQLRQMVSGERPTASYSPRSRLISGVRHQPVDLVPGGGHLGGHGVAEDVGDGPEQVVVDHLVLVRFDAQGDVLVADLESRFRKLVGVFHQHGGKGCDRSGQGLLLAAVRLVPAVEDAVQKRGMRLEQVLVEALGDFVDVRSDHRKGGLDDGDG